MSWGETIRRAIGLKPSLRRSSGSSMSNILFGTVLGIISGKYIFEEPMKEYWDNEEAQGRVKTRSVASAGASAGDGAGAGK
eukprot:CAMPEP_0197250476 /NCGR_PEP_ID=MMETSP1429-20130617/53024_1 /TAXON_ID=49237 /ORGANISM="Chaetoceros  sp., Strain UNC1202" /LENGTH=80 /DNA_ID=CAMNT_0042712311 /DNA_START=33 /DNA_END=275 /DNA_ORIENTATION=-